MHEAITLNGRHNFGCNIRKIAHKILVCKYMVQKMTHKALICQTENQNHLISAHDPN